MEMREMDYHITMEEDLARLIEIMMTTTSAVLKNLREHGGK